MKMEASRIEGEAEKMSAGRTQIEILVPAFRLVKNKMFLPLYYFF